MRYKFIPYLYDLMWNCEKTGYPVMRPLFFHYQSDEETLCMNDEFMFGENILVAPVLEQGKLAREVYLPEGEWYDYWTNEKTEGKKYIVKKTPLDVCPIYIKSGSIIPCFEEMSYVGEKNMDVLTLSVYPSEGKYLHYRDDGESFNYKNGEYNSYEFSMAPFERVNYEINLSQLTNNYKEYETINIILNDDCVNEIKLDDKDVSFKNVDNKVLFSISGAFNGNPLKTLKVYTCRF